MLAANALEQHPDIGDEELLDVLSSNLCRCTGYQNIIKAVKAARDEMRGAKAAMMRSERQDAWVPSPLRGGVRGGGREICVPHRRHPRPRPARGGRGAERRARHAKRT